MKMFPGCRSACTKPSSKIIFSSMPRPRPGDPLRDPTGCRVGTRILVPSMKLHGQDPLGRQRVDQLGEDDVGDRRRSCARKRRLLRASIRKSSCADGAPELLDGGDRRQRPQRREITLSSAPPAASPPGRTCRARRRWGGGPSPPRSGRRAAAPCAPATPTPRRAAPARTRRRARRAGGPDPPRCVRDHVLERERADVVLQLASAWMTCGGRRSGRVLMICPTLMKVAPSSRNRSTTTRRTRPAAAPSRRSSKSRSSHPTRTARAWPPRPGRSRRPGRESHGQDGLSRESRQRGSESRARL